jgi:hypothetical protein
MATSYQVMVKIGLQNHVSPGLLTLSGQITGIQSQVQRLGNVFAQMMAGRMMADFGSKMVHGFKSAVTSAAELQRQMIGIQTVTKGTAQEMTRLEASIMKVTGVTTFSNVQIAEMAKLIATSSNFTAQQVTDLVPVIAKYADVQYIFKKTPPQQSALDAIRAAHLAQHYTPAELTKYLDLLTKTSFLTPGKMSEVITTLKYVQGLASGALGMNDQQIALLTALANRVGVAGAGARGGAQVANALMRTIPGVFGSGLLKGKSAEALAAMGFSDAQGHSTIFTGGKFDVAKFLGQLDKYETYEYKKYPEQIAREHIMRNLQHAFGAAARVITVLGKPEVWKQYHEMMIAYNNLPTTEAAQEKFAKESVWQQIINAETNFHSLLTLIGEKTLPEVSWAFSKLNGILGQIIEKLGKGDGSLSTGARVGIYTLGGLGLAIENFAKILEYSALIKYLGGFRAVLVLLVSPLRLVSTALIRIVGGGMISTLAGGITGVSTAASLASAPLWLVVGALGAITAAAYGIYKYTSKAPPPPGFHPEKPYDPNKPETVPPFMINPNPWTINPRQPVDPDTGRPISKLDRGTRYASYYARGGGTNYVQVHTQIKLNERVLAEAVTDHQVRGTDRALGTGYADMSYGAVPVALG